MRAAVQASDDAGTALAKRFGVTAQTIYKWRKRDSVEDRSHTPHRLQTTLTPAQEAVAVALRKTLLVSLDDLLAVVRELWETCAISRPRQPSRSTAPSRLTSLDTSISVSATVPPYAARLDC